MKAACTGCGLSVVPSPSMVVIFLPIAALTGVMQERPALPSICTVQAPHWARPQPNLGPLNLRSLRRAYKSGVLGARVTTCLRALSLSVSFTVFLRSVFIGFELTA